MKCLLPPIPKKDTLSVRENKLKLKWDEPHNLKIIPQRRNSVFFFLLLWYALSVVSFSMALVTRGPPGMEVHASNLST